MKISSIPKSGREDSIVYVNSRHGKVARQYVRPRDPRTLEQKRKRSNLVAVCNRWRTRTPGATSPSFTLPGMACRKPARPFGFAPASTLTAGPMSLKWPAPASPPQPHSDAPGSLLRPDGIAVLGEVVLKSLGSGGPGRSQSL